MSKNERAARRDSSAKRESGSESQSDESADSPEESDSDSDPKPSRWAGGAAEKEQAANKAVPANNKAPPAPRSNLDLLLELDDSEYLRNAKRTSEI